MSILDRLGQTYNCQSISVDGHIWSFIQTKSDGIPLILLPGAQGTCEVYANQILGLGSDIRIIAATYPEVDDCPSLAAGFKSFLDAMDVTKAVISGTSFGGLWLQFFAARFPEYVAGLILANTFIDSKSKHPMFDHILAMGDADLIEAVRAGFIAATGKSPRHAELAEIMDALVGAVQTGAGLKSRLRGVRLSAAAPKVALEPDQITLIECDNDPLVDQAMRDEIAERYRGSARHVLEGGEHYPAILNPEEYSTILRGAYIAATKGTAQGRS